MYKKFLFAVLVFLSTSVNSLAAELRGYVSTSNGTAICALAIASGRTQFTCSPIGEFYFKDLPLEPDGRIKLQLYADGFVPNVKRLTDFSYQNVVMERANCGNDEEPQPPVDSMKVSLLKPEHTEVIPQNNPATGCEYDSRVGYGLRVDFDWSDAKSTAGIKGYHLYAKGRRATLPIVNTFVQESKYTDISCGSYVINLNASSGFSWSVQAEDNDGNLGPINDQGFFIYELCYLDNGQPCG